MSGLFITAIVTTTFSSPALAFVVFTTNVGVVISSYWAVIVILPVMLSKTLSQPINLYPSLVGSSGAIAAEPSSTCSTFSSVPS